MSLILPLIEPNKSRINKNNIKDTVFLEEIYLTPIDYC